MPRKKGVSIVRSEAQKRRWRKLHGLPEEDSGALKENGRAPLDSEMRAYRDIVQILNGLPRMSRAGVLKQLGA